MPQFLKKLFRKEGVINFFARLASAYMRFVFKTTRWRWVGLENPKVFLKQKKSFVLSFWHQRISMAVFSWPYSVPISMIISAHRDGRLIAHTVAKFGVKWIAGSTSKGGTQALRTAVKRLKNGECVGITPDGPRGPCRQVQPGTIIMAQLAGVDILPFSFSMNHCAVLKTWDSFVLPLPFGKGVMGWGEAVHVSGRDLKESQKALENGMIELQEHLDRMLHEGKKGDSIPL